MLPLLYSTIYFLTRSLNGVGAHPLNTTFTTLPTSGCENIDNCRTLDGIVQIYLVTILACVWLAVHRNVPAPPPKSEEFGAWAWRTILNTMESLFVLIAAFVAPEWILAWAIHQAIMALKLCWKLEEAKFQAYSIQTRTEPSVMKPVGISNFEIFIPRAWVKKVCGFEGEELSLDPIHATCTSYEGNECRLERWPGRISDVSLAFINLVSSFRCNEDGD